MSETLTIVEPLQITDAILDCGCSPPKTNVPEDDYPQWDSGTTYAIGDRVILLTTHKIYESLQNSNLNKNPSSTENLAWWVEVAPTNRWAAFDTSISTSTVQADNITFELTPGKAINTIGLLNIIGGTQLNITMYSPNTGSPGIVYERTIDLGSLPFAPDWWSWFYNRSPELKQSILFDLPSYVDCIIKVELLGGSNLSVGTVLIGQQYSVGLGIKYGARIGIQDYSRKETNDFGDTILLKRAFAKRVNFELFLNNFEVDSLNEKLIELRATPCLWVGSEEFDATTIFGFYKNFDILISYTEHSDCELEIEGLT